MVYLVVLFLPFLAPFFRSQPIIGVLTTICAIVFVGFAFQFPVFFLCWPAYSLQQLQRTWNYRRHGLCVADHIEDIWW